MVTSTSAFSITNRLRIPYAPRALGRAEAEHLPRGQVNYLRCLSCPQKTNKGQKTGPLFAISSRLLARPPWMSLRKVSN